MDYTEINKALVAIVELRNQKEEGNREQLKSMEDAFMGSYGNALKEVMLDIQDEYFPDSEMEPLMSYIASHHEVAGENQWGKAYQTQCTSGASVEIDDYPDKSTHIVIMPNPLRVVLHIDEHNSHQIWTAQKPTYVA